MSYFGYQNYDDNSYYNDGNFAYQNSPNWGPLELGPENFIDYNSSPKIANIQIDSCTQLKQKTEENAQTQENHVTPGGPEDVTPGEPEEYTPGNPDEEINLADEVVQSNAQVPQNDEKAQKIQNEDTFDDELYDPSNFQDLLKEFIYEYDPDNKPRGGRFTITVEIPDDLYHNNNNEEEVSEDMASETTRDGFDGQTIAFDDARSVNESVLSDSVFAEADPTWIKFCFECMKYRTDEERVYIKELLPNLFSELRDMKKANPYLQMNQDVFNEIIKENLHFRENYIAEENRFLAGLVEDEVLEIGDTRPEDPVEHIYIMGEKRRLKAGFKNHRNHSNKNHMNENYVSNVFQFAKHHYKSDKDVQKIANTRNVSAKNFKALTRNYLKDTALIRKAKTRIIASGRELIGNAEYWMKAGFFEQCTEREKYIIYKDKALTDLVLDRRY